MNKTAYIIGGICVCSVLMLSSGCSKKEVKADQAPAISETTVVETPDTVEVEQVELMTEQAVDIPATYKVQKGDTLWKISDKVYGSGKKWAKIYYANKSVIPDPDKLKAGVTLVIPEE